MYRYADEFGWGLKFFWGICKREVVQKGSDLKRFREVTEDAFRVLGTYSRN